jgi:hypothetical protein
MSKSKKHIKFLKHLIKRGLKAGKPISSEMIDLYNLEIKNKKDKI